MKKYNKRKVLCAFMATLVLIFLTNGISAQNVFRKITDFDGDGKTDFAIARNENGLKIWYTQQSTAGYGVFQWGLATDQIAPGDYDGDGKTDYAVMREAPDQSGFIFQTFHILLSSNNSYFQKPVSGSIGFTGVTPHQQDYDGDGKTDLAAFHPNSFSGTIVVVESTTNTTKTFTLPANNFSARIGDLTGDGKADYVAVNLSTYNVRITDYATNTTQTLQYGIAGDQFVPGDFDGDGTGDLTVFRATDGSWWTMRSSDGTVQVANWGTVGDIPVAGDYDGDGKTDVAIWRKSSPQSYFWVYGSQAGVQVLPFGISTDTVVRY
jgi:hypothetical protein